MAHGARGYARGASVVTLADAWAEALWEDAMAARGALTVTMVTREPQLDWCDAEQPILCPNCVSIPCRCSQRGQS
jgi:hypothetical protein